MKPRVSWRLGAAFGVVGLAAIFGGACSSAAEEGSAAGSPGVSTGSGGGGGGGDSSSIGAGTLGCSPACTPPQFCGAANVCIDQGTCAGDADCEAGKICDKATQTCVPGGGCGAQEAKIDNVPPNLLIVLDRSCSMTDAVGNTTKWKIAVKAITTMTTTYKDEIRFGLSLFPDLVAPDCGQDAITIPVAPGKEMDIVTLLTAALKKADPYFPDGPCVTNIDTAMQQAQTEPAFTDPARDSYALLITDGKQSSGCETNPSMDPADGKTLKAIQKLAAAGVSTFVLGFGNGVDVAQMNKFADAGGVPSSGANKFYDAGDQASLDAALKTIAEKTLSCSYTLDKTPSDPGSIYVFFNNDTKVERDPTHASGWDYDQATNQLTFYGAQCDDLKNAVVTDVDIVLGCDAPTPD